MTADNGCGTPFMRAKAVRDLLGISEWDLRKLVAEGALQRVWPVGRWRGGEPKRRKRTRMRGERVPYYRREDAMKLAALALATDH